FQAEIALRVHLRLVLLREEGEDVHARRVVPQEERFARLFRLIHETLRMPDKHFVEGFHVVLSVSALLPMLMIRAHILERLEWPFVDNSLLADFAPARH